MSDAGTHNLFRFQLPALVVGILGMALLAVGGLGGDSGQFYRAYLVGFIFVAGIGIGSLALLMLQYLTGGSWGILIRRHLEAAVKTLPLLMLAFIPIVIGMRHIYPWAVPGGEHDEMMVHKHAYLNPGFFIGRAVFFFLAWSLIGYFLTRWDRRFEETMDPRLGLAQRKLSAVGLLFAALGMTFVSIDWVMSIEHAWYSTMFGISYIVGNALTALCFCVLMLVALHREEPLATYARPGIFRDLGNLMLAFTMLWAYTAFSEFLLIWYANIREEVPYFLHRMEGGWGVVSILLIVFHFFLPFFMLLMRAIKDRPKTLGIVASLLLIMRVVDYIWIIVPSFHSGLPEPSGFHWTYLAAAVGLAGLWFYAFLNLVKREPLLPMYEEEVTAALSGDHKALSHG